MDLYLQLLLILVLFSFSAFFSGIETALFSLSQIGLEKIKTKSPAKADLIARLLRDPNATINMIITGNTLVNVAFSVVWARLFLERWGEYGLVYAVTSGTLLLLVFAELTPKVLAIANPVAFASYGVGLLNALSVLLLPISRIFETLISRLFAVLGLKTRKMDLSLSEDELQALLEIGTQEGVLAEAERDMLEEAMDLDERTVDEIMTPRVDIVAVDVLSKLSDIKEIARQRRHSRLPVYKGTIDYILGYIKLKEVLLHPEKDWRSFMRKALMVPESKTITDLLQDFREQGETMAIVVDEYGGTAGLVTIEDVIEELLGEITDEFDKEQKEILRRSDGAYLVSGKTSLRDLGEELGIEFDVDKVETVGGFVMHKLGHVPKGGERILYKGWIWEVEKVKGNRIVQVVIKSA